MDIQSINPNTEYKRWGGLAGVMEGMNSANIEAADQQQLLANLYKNQMDQVKARQALADDNDPTMEYWRQRGNIGGNMEKYSKGAHDFGTLETGIDAGNAGNKLKTSDAQINTVINDIDQAMAFFEQAPEGLPSVYGAGQFLSPTMQQLAQQVGGVENMKRILPVLRERILKARTDTAAHRGKMEEVTTTANAGIKGHELSAKASMYGADKQLEAARLRLREAEAQQKAAESSRREAEISRRINANIHEFNALQADLRRIDEEMLGIKLIKSPDNDPIKSKALQAEKRKELEDRKKMISSEQENLRKENKRLNSLSTFAGKEEKDVIKLD